MKRLLIAKRTMRYATRRLLPGDTFEAKKRDAELLTKVGRAEYAPTERAAVQLPPMPDALRDRAMAGKPVVGAAAMAHAAPTTSLEPEVTAAAGDMADLRAQYERVVGKKPFNGWDADTLREKMAAAGAS